MRAVLLVMAAMAMAQGALAEPYRWPLDLPQILTSSFAEYRTGRFHAGIDLRTGGIGREVYAAGDGYVSRLRCSPYGYGKALYLQLDDGRTAVYAHLDGFADRLRARVRSEQHARQSYTVDIHLDAGSLPVRKGEMIATSGQTGIGAPHLHYELRDAAQRPINPRLLGVEWPDATRPVLNKLLAAPLDRHARVNGDMLPEVIGLVHRGDGRYTCAPIEAWGALGFGIDLTDPGEGGYKLGIHTLELAVLDPEAEGIATAAETIFRMRHDRLSYDNHRNGVVAYHPFLLEHGRFLVLWRWPGNVCDSYTVFPGNGVWDVPQSPRTLRLTASDFAGNTAVLDIPVRPMPPEVQPESGLAGTGEGQAEVDCMGEHLLVSARFNRPEELAPQLIVETGAGIEALPMAPVSPLLYRIHYKPKRGGLHQLRVDHPRVAPSGAEVAVSLRGESKRVHHLGGLAITTASDTPYGAWYARVFEAADAAATPMPPLGRVYKIWPEGMPMDTPVEIAFPMPEGAEQARRVQVYRRSGSGWSAQNTRREGGNLVIETRSLGAFALMEDTQPPTITNVSPSIGEVAQSRRPRIQATIAENAAGVKDYSVHCNGQWLLTAYDPERNRIAWERDVDLPSGRQRITFRVVDGAGNVAETERFFQVP